VISAAVQTTIAAGIVIGLLRISKHWSPAIRETIAAIATVKFLLPATFLGGGLFAWAAASHGGESLMALSWPVAVGVHVAGSVIVLGALLADVVCGRRLIRASTAVAEGLLHERFAVVARRMGLRRMPRIWVSTDAEGPLAFGLFRRHIVLPARLTEDGAGALDVVVAHEMAHHVRGDLWMLALHRAAVTIWWWHPLAWRLGRELREILEDGCDDRVVASGVASRDQYRDVLMACARTSAASRPTALGFADRRHPVARRILRLGGNRVARTSWPSTAAALSLAAVLLPGIPEPPHAEVQVVVVQRITRVNP
jgi:beta-lactamase regulating signal transducer with metallopeptidase domain